MDYDINIYKHAFVSVTCSIDSHAKTAWACQYQPAPLLKSDGSTASNNYPSLATSPLHPQSVVITGINLYVCRDIPYHAAKSISEASFFTVNPTHVCGNNSMFQPRLSCRILRFAVTVAISITQFLLISTSAEDSTLQIIHPAWQQRLLKNIRRVSILRLKPGSAIYL